MDVPLFLRERLLQYNKVLEQVTYLNTLLKKNLSTSILLFARQAPYLCLKL